MIKEAQGPRKYSRQKAFVEGSNETLPLKLQLLTISTAFLEVYNPQNVSDHR